MSIFSSTFETSNESNLPINFNWISLQEIKQLDEIIADSFIQPILLFKHSTRCSISRMALKQFEKQFKTEEKVALYLLDLIAFRTISNEIASRFDVEHQSPQILLLKKGKSVYNASHHQIDAAIVLQHLIM